MKTKQDQTVHILVVEDDIQIGRLIGLAMPTLGIPYQFTSAMSAVEALALWKKIPFDLLLTDYNLPGMNGLRMIEELKKQGATVPMILFTAYANARLEREAMLVGVSEYIPKPFDIEYLIDRIRSYLSVTDMYNS